MSNSITHQKNKKEIRQKKNKIIELHYKKQRIKKNDFISINHIDYNVKS
jgi:hypothetical protein